MGLSEEDKNTNINERSSNDTVRDSYSLPKVPDSPKTIAIGEKLT
jgi:hypothetical protein